ncbi:trypco2 family protein [Streptomyces morookaense]|uniref:trypco2 family protein n=1 Tax=Streptomyces morookaense TaxID=1970 RepID=UPI00198F6C86|nr:trypco2 family protein [Streptomyces morookaense]GHF41632.1 hypothetical protein GCM10010359_50380 [Streptomyces morookaense]
MSIALAELIGQLRTELTEAMHAGQDTDLRFEVGRVELELTVAVDKEAAPGAKVRFWVVELGAEAKRSSNTTQRITLELVPRSTDRPGQSPLISGAGLPGER